MTLEEYREKLLKDIRFWNRILEEPDGSDKQKYALQEMIHVATSIYYDLGNITIREEQS